jgi:hypothetical protein
VLSVVGEASGGTAAGMVIEGWWMPNSQAKWVVDRVIWRRDGAASRVITRDAASRRR